ncbi:transposase, partial [Jannaschia formosa]|uniref:transposase n=1 Tax=Jannaschia formosa TaxID=2259592 RepID=UPI001074E7A6
LDEAATSEIASFACGLASDHAAVAAALTEPWSNGQTEGQINRLKTLKRQMYGRVNIDLLKARLVAAS